MPPCDGLTAKQNRVITALLTSPSITEAAQISGIPERTIFHWLNEAGFKAAYQAAKREAFNQSLARLQQASSGAVTVLASVMIDPHERGSIRVSAAKIILEFAIKSVEIEDLQTRLEVLESLIGGQI